MDIQKGDRVIVTNSLYGMYDGKKGFVHRVLENGEDIEVILDVNKGKIGEITRLFMRNVEKEIVIQPTPVSSKEVGEATKKVLGQITSIDDRLDNLEIILNKYDLSVKDSCGFMYIYDFLDELSQKFDEISSKDKEEIAFCILGEKL